jgi:hypothetical protein
MPFFAIGLPHGSEWILILALVLLGPVLWACALVSCLRNESSSGNTKIVWTLIILLVHVVGPIAYFLVRRPQRIRELGH